MSQKKRPARLWLRPDTGTWFIKDGSKRIPTECREDEVAAAQERLANYIASKYQPQRSSRSAEVTIADIVIVYSEEKAQQTARPKETLAMLDRVNDFFGDMLLTEIKGQTCRDYAADRGNLGGARRDLETLRAAIRYYHGEHTLDMVPKITLPEKGMPRQKWLTRQEVARLLRAARREKQCGHLVRLIMIGLYTGTRLSATLNLQWMPNTTAGHVDLDRGVIYRRAEGERVAHNKRRTPVKIPPRLLRFLRYWHKADTVTDSDGRTVTMRYVITYAGEKITKPHKAFRTIRDSAGFADDVTPHVLRHTRATWLAQAGVDTEQAAASLGMTSEEFERTYAHASPDFQQQAANAF
ncbi:site-specific integrase [Rhizobium sp. NXC24]|uniref:tyrosine-type recombinase/integrase n=1 Tax=Rhizobium sp. NXC24 TaxID=2048897 RepID=UPI000CDF3C26|nr:site-specific integrase [Rhizobium sp. NXC24]AVA20649.1 integrase/recombinase family protein [Rhizobium sp. NXC24]